jgi:ABC-type branched-subunit amino acid transport system substrate-binding protein
VLRPGSLAVPIALLCGCASGGPSGDRPVPALARSPAAAHAFSELRRRWPVASREERIAFEEHLAALRQLYQTEAVARVADVYLAWVALEKGDLPRARQLAAASETGGPGNTRDLGTLLEGAALSRSGHPAEGLAMLRPLVGKLLDPYARALLHEEAVRAAVATQQWTEVVDLLDAWLLDAAEDERPAVLEVASRALTEVPAPTLISRLFAMKEDDENGSSRHAEALEKAMARRLADVAIARGDGDIARKLLAGGQVSALGAKGADVVELARANTAVPQIAGRKVGLLVPAGALASRGADATLGALAALGLLGGATTLDDRLAARDDGGNEANAERAFASLAEAGAAVVIGGFDADGATMLAELAERARVPTLLLTPPRKPPESQRWSFVVAPSVASSDAAAIAAMAAKGARKIAVVGAAAALIAEGSTTVLPSVDCVSFTPHPGSPRYPIGAWRAQGVDAILLAGDVRCTTDALDELATLRVPLMVALGAQAAGAVLPPPKGAAPGKTRPLPAFVASLGCFPVDEAGRPSAAMTTSTEDRGAPPTWWTVAARDATELAARAMAGLPETTAREEGEITRRRVIVRDAILRGDASSCLGAIAGSPGTFRVVVPKR